MSAVSASAAAREALLELWKALESVPHGFLPELSEPAPGAAAHTQLDAPPATATTSGATASTGVAAAVAAEAGAAAVVIPADRIATSVAFKGFLKQEGDDDDLRQRKMHKINSMLAGIYTGEVD